MGEIERGTVIVVPHFDDELYCAGSLLIKYPYNITVIVTHPSDTCPAQKLWKQKLMFEMSIKTLNEIRTTKGYLPIDYKIINGALPNGLPPEEYLSAISTIEKSIDQYEVIDYYVYTVKSGHQSHTECNQIAMAVMRHNYLDKMKVIFEAPYPMSYFTPGVHSDSDKSYDSFIRLSKEGAYVLHDIIENIYGEKSPANSILGAEAFLDALKFFGRNVNSPFAQPFRCKRYIG